MVRHRAAERHWVRCLPCPEPGHFLTAPIMLRRQPRAGPAVQVFGLEHGRNAVRDEIHMFPLRLTNAVRNGRRLED